MSTSRAGLPFLAYASDDPDGAPAVTPHVHQEGGRVVMGGSNGAPTLVSATPGENSNMVAVGSDIVLTFSGNVSGTGTIRIGDGYTQSYIDKAGVTETRWVGSTDSHIVNLSDTSQVTISGNTITIDLANDLKPGLNYSVTVAPGVLHDNFGRPYAGLADSSKLHFTTDASVVAQISGAIHFEDSGVSSTDYITNSAAQTVHGTYSGILGASEHIEVSIDNGVHWQTANASNGSWSCSSFDALSASSTMLARVMDANDAPRNTVSQAFVFDNTAPTMDNKAPISDSTLTAGETATVTITFSEQVSGVTVLDQTVTGSTYGTFHTADNGLTWTATVTPNPVTHASNVGDILHIGATDLAGNALSTADGADYVFVQSYDINTDIGLSADTGVSQSDFYTATAAQTLTGSYVTLPSGGSVMVSLDGGSTFNAATVNAGNHTWSLNGTLQNGTSSIVVHVNDAQNVPQETYSHDYTLDTQAASQSMAAVSVDLDTGDDSAGTSNADNITNHAIPHVTVYTGDARTLHTGDVIQIIDTNHGNAIVGSYVLLDTDLVSYGGGNYATSFPDKDIRLDHLLSDGEHDLKVQIGDLAGNTPGTASSSALALIIDTQAPTLISTSPAADAPSVPHDTTDFVLTFNEALHISEGATVTLSDGSNNVGIAISDADLSAGGTTLTIHLSSPLSGSTEYSVAMNGTISDVAGNVAVSGDQTVLHFTTDVDGNLQPQAPYIIANATTTTTVDAVQSFSGHFYSESGTDKVQMLDGGNGWIDAGTSPLDGAVHGWSVTPSAPADVIEVRMVDSNGTPLEYQDYGNSVLYISFSGNDVIAPSGSNAIVFGGSGNDTIVVGDAAHVTTGSGSNTVTAGDNANISSNGFDGVHVGANATVALNGSGSTVYATGDGLALTTADGGSHSIVINNLNVSSIAGGTGSDTLNFNFDSTSVVVGNLSSSDHMSGIDILDSAGTGNTITISALTDVTALSGTSTLAIAGVASTIVHIDGAVWDDTHTTNNGYEVYEGTGNHDIHLLVLTGLQTTLT